MQLKNKRGDVIATFSNRTLRSETGEPLELRDILARDEILASVHLCCIRLTLGDFESARISRSTLLRVQFEGGWFTETNFDDTTISNSEFYDITALASQYCRIKFSDVVFLGANLADSVFMACDFVNTSFRRDRIGHETSLRGSDLSKTELAGVAFDGAIYDSETRFPPGFDPESAPGLTKR